MTYISPNLERLWGYKVEEVLNNPDYWQTFAHPDDLPLLQNGIVEALAAKAHEVRIEYRARHMTLGYRWAQSIIVFSYDASGPVDSLSYIQDITERKQADDALRKNGERLNRIFGSSPAGIGLTSLADGRFYFFNDSALRMSGYSRAEVEGKTNAGLGFWLDKRSLARLIVTLRKGKPVLNYEHTVQIKSGAQLHLLSSFDLIEMEGEPYVVNISIDITARKQAEDAARWIGQERLGLREMGRLLADEGSLDDLLFKVTDSVKLIFGRAQAVTIWLYDAGTGLMEAKAWTGYNDDVMHGLTTTPNRGIVGSIFTKQEPQIIDDYSSLMGKRTTGKATLDETKSLIGVPLRSKGQVIGVLFAMSFTVVGAFGNEDVQLLQSLANEVALTIINRQLFDAERQARYLSEKLRLAYLGISRSLNLNEVLDNLLQVLYDLVPYDSADVELLQNGNQLTILAARGYEKFVPGQRVMGMTFDLDMFGLTKRMFVTQQSLLAKDVHLYPEWVSLPESAHIKSWLGVPIVVQGKVIGLYSVDKAEPNFFTEEHLVLAEHLALPAAIAIANARLFEEVSVNRVQLQLLTRRVYQAQEEERLRLSRELHDELGAMLTPLKSRLFKVPEEAAADPQVIGSEMETAIDMVDDVIQRVRSLGRELRPPSIDAVGIGPVMADYCRNFGRNTRLAVEFISLSPLPALPGDFSIGLYRILQEALTNVVKHAEAKQVWVTLSIKGKELVLVIQDDGKGFGPDADMHSSQGIGLAGMRERVALLDGTLTISSAPQAGVRLEARLPVPEVRLE